MTKGINASYVLAEDSAHSPVRSFLNLIVLRRLLAGPEIRYGFGIEIVFIRNPQVSTLLLLLSLPLRNIVDLAPQYTSSLFSRNIFSLL